MKVEKVCWKDPIFSPIAVLIITIFSLCAKRAAEESRRGQRENEATTRGGTKNNGGRRYSCCQRTRLPTSWPELAMS